MCAPSLSSSIVAQGVGGQQPPQQQTDISGEIRIGNGRKSHLAIPAFVASDADAATQAAAKTITDVFRDDVAFESEFDVIPAKAVDAVPPATSLESIPVDNWTEMGATFVAFGTVARNGKGFDVAVHIVSVATKQDRFGKDYKGDAADARQYAHQMSDEMHKELFRLDGVARTKITFVSDRDGERMAGPIDPRPIKEIYIADYDGANPHRFTANRSLNSMPVWSPDNAFIAYAAYPLSGSSVDVLVQSVTGPVRSLRPAKSGTFNTYEPSWSPDGKKIAFASDRIGDGGKFQIYVVNADGTGAPQKLTSSKDGSNSTPTWSPNGSSIAFVSDRGGAPAVYVMGVDGTRPTKLTSESHADRPTWSPDSSKLAYVAQTSSGSNDIYLHNFANSSTIQLTNSEGNNESPSFSPNGRHIIFTTTRWGKAQLAIISLDGNVVKRVTSTGNNTYPNWGHLR